MKFDQIIRGVYGEIHSPSSKTDPESLSLRFVYTLMEKETVETQLVEMKKPKETVESKCLELETTTTGLI